MTNGPVGLNQQWRRILATENRVKQLETGLRALTQQIDVLMEHHAASGTEAQRAENAQTGSVHDGQVAIGETPKGSLSRSKGE